MISHFGLLLVFAAFVVTTFAVLMHDRPAAQLRYGLKLLAWFVGAAGVLAWVMYAASC